MKNNILILLGFCLCVTAMTFQSCTADLCKDKVCLNGATCNEGVCLCPTGFSGENCEIEDPCLNTVCNNGGTCLDGSCLCVPGYEGDSCDVVSADKYIGLFEAGLGNVVVEVCDGDTLTYTYPSEIRKHPVNFGEIQIKKLGAYETTDNVDYWVSGTITSATKFEISTTFGPFNGDQNYFAMTGSGEYDAATRVLTIDYVCTFSDVAQTTYVCKATYTYL